MADYLRKHWLRVIIPILIVTAWLTAAGIGGPYFGRIEEVSEVDLTAFLPESAEATKVANRLGSFVNEDSLAAVVVFSSTDNSKLTDDERSEIESSVNTLTEVDGVLGDVSPAIVSDDEEAAFAVIQADTNKSLEEVVSQVREKLEQQRLEGVETFVTGPAGFAADLNVAFAGIDGLLLVTALAVVFVILVVVYRSALLPVIVLLASIFALSASILIVFTLAKLGVVELNGQVQGILFILTIGAATDYSLLYVARYREALYEKKHRYDATKIAFKGALEPILASGGTVIVGLLCLFVSDLASNKALGPVGSIGVAMAMLSALTFLPATLLLTGRKAFWPVIPQATLAARTSHKKKLQKGVWHKVGGIVNRQPRRVWVLTSLLLVVCAAFAPQLRADGVAQSDLILGYSEAREGQSELNKHFPDGSGSPAFVLINQKVLNAAVETIDATEGVSAVAITAKDTPSGTAPVGESQAELEETLRESVRRQQMSVPEAARASLPPVESVVRSIDPFAAAKPVVSEDEVLLQVTLADDPNSSAAKATVERLRRELKNNGVVANVGGATAAQLDTTNASIRDRTVIIPLVLVAITIILAVLLRSLIAPVLLLATTVLSFAASIGVAAVLFNSVLDFPGADPSVLLYGFVFLVALGIDYNIFLMTRVREESLKIGTAKGVIRGLVVTGGVITSAGIVLAATFAALGVIPILFLFQLAFIVAFGVLLDTLIVRSLLVPALIKDIGSFVWWPSNNRKP